MDPSASSQLNSDISAIIAAMPDAFSLLSTANSIPTTKPAALLPGDLPLLMNAEQLNTFSNLMLLQQQQMLMNMNPFVFGGLPLPIHNLQAMEALNLANSARPQSQSATASPKQSVSSDMRPRAFSSAATLQPSMLPADKRRKRSHQDDFVPLGTTKHSSILMGLVEGDEDIIPMHQNPPTKSEDERLKQDIARILARSRPEQPPRKRSPEDTTRLRPLIRDEDLPDSVGPDSPFRHHPKYQRKNFGLDRAHDDTDAVAFAVASGIWAPAHSGASSETNSSAGSSPKDYATENAPKSFHEMLDQTLARELVAAE